MIVVSDTSPLITLAKIDHLEQLRILFGTVTIPPEVSREFSATGADRGVPDIDSLSRGWLVTRAPTSLLTFPNLDPGEAAAISLAIELGASSLLIDEKTGRKVAAENGVPVLGTLGVLIEAAERGHIDLDEAFRHLKTTDFRFPAKTLDAILLSFHQRQTDGVSQ